MNRFDRVTAILLLLQTRSVVTAKFLAERFEVTERTIYRDIRTLENAGVPIGSEGGIGYFLEKGFRLPPVSFTLDEASSLLLGEKLLSASLDEQSLSDFGNALSKVRAVIDRTDKDYLTALEDSTAVLPTGSHFPVDSIYQRETEQSSGETTAVDPLSTQDQWLRECRTALLKNQVVEIEYIAQNRPDKTNREIEPIGLFYYGWHWHLIAWCRLRKTYRDFRLDRIETFNPRPTRFKKHDHKNLQEYLNDLPDRESLQDVTIQFGLEAARFVEEQRYFFGFIDEEVMDDCIHMRFLTPVPEYMARWLLQYLDDIQIVEGDGIRELLQSYTQRLAKHWIR